MTPPHGKTLRIFTHYRIGLLVSSSGPELNRYPVPHSLEVGYPWLRWHGWARTTAFRLMRPALYPLSYTPVWPGVGRRLPKLPRPTPGRPEGLEGAQNRPQDGKNELADSDGSLTDLHPLIKAHACTHDFLQTLIADHASIARRCHTPTSGGSCQLSTGERYRNSKTPGAALASGGLRCMYLVVVQHLCLVLRGAYGLRSVPLSTNLPTQP